MKPIRGSRQHVASRARAVLQDHLDEPITITALSHKVGVSERTLRNAFVDVYRESPKRFFLKQRLHAVREALSARGAEHTTVTAIAMDYGFFELGRFAGQYKAVFGESPSQTLHDQGSSWNQILAG
jgi:AraC family ethanolamine operon transcriptional activator